MATEILGAGVLGLVAILVLGGLLALSATLLPRILKYGDAGPGVRWSLGEPGSFDLTEPAPPREVDRPAPALPPREPEPLLAAAIGLALSLYQQQQVQIVGMQAPAAATSAWAMSGRWQAMQARLNRQKR